MAEGVRGPSEISAISTAPVGATPHLGPSHLPKAHPVGPSYWGLGLQHINFGETNIQSIMKGLGMQAERGGPE